MKEFNVEAGITPGIILFFSKEEDVDAETIDNLLEQHKDKEMLSLIVHALQKADALQKGINLSDYKFRGLNMKIALPPVVALKSSRG
jgi:hypothetical protein